MACGSPSLAVIPGVYILLNLVLGEAVAFLDFTFELITLAIDSSKIVVGEVAPLLFDLTLDLLSGTFELDSNPCGRSICVDAKTNSVLIPFVPRVK